MKKRTINLKSEYIVKPENKVVIATLMNRGKNDEGSIYSEIYNNCTEFTKKCIGELLYNFKELNTREYYKYKGVARCDEFDTFNEEIGKKIAINKAESKYHVDMIKRYEKLALIFKNAAEEMYNLEIKHLKKLKENKRNIYKYYSK